MLKQINWWLEPPIFPDDEEKTARARTMNVIGTYFLLALVIAALIYAPFFVKHKIETWGVLLALLIFYAIARACMFRGKLAFASRFMFAAIWILCEGLAFAGGGITSPLLFALVAITIAVGLLSARRVGTVFLVTSILIGLGFAVLQQSGVILPQYFFHTPLGVWFIFALSLVFINWTINLTVRTLENTLASARQQDQARQKAEATLRESEEKYRLLFDNAGDAIFIHDEAAHILAANALAVERLGYTRPELLAMTAGQVDAPEQRKYVPERIERLVRLGHHTFETVHQCKDGSLVPTVVSARRIVWDGMPAILSICHDITERKKVEAALRESEARFRTIYDMEPECVKIINPDCTLVAMNPAGLAMIEADSLEMVKGQSVLSIVDEKYRDEFKQFTENVCQKGASGKLEFKMIGLKGTPRWLETRAVPLRDTQEKISGLLGVTRDITERKHAEAAEHEQRALAEALSNSVAALNSTLNIEDVLDRILDNVGRVVAHDSVGVILLDDARQTGQILGYRDTISQSANMKGTRFSVLHTRNLREMQVTGAPVIIADTRAYDGWLANLSNDWVRASLGVPITVRGETIGFLCLASATPNAFTALDAERLQTFGDYAAIAIENARLYEEVQKLALTDTLTGIFNRTFFEAELSRMELARDYPVSIVIADLDNMKITNDRLGHLAGDELLKHTVHVLQAVFRAGDIIARIGGDEFAVLLPNTGPATVEQSLSRIRLKLAEHNLQHPELIIRLSLGAATAEQGGLLEAFSLADQRMYQDKAMRKSKGIHLHWNDLAEGHEL